MSAPGAAAGPMQNGVSGGSASPGFWGADSASCRSAAAAPCSVPVQWGCVLHSAVSPAHACAQAMQHAPPGTCSKAALPCTPVHTLQRSVPGAARAHCSTRARRALHTHANTHTCCSAHTHTDRAEQTHPPCTPVHGAAVHTHTQVHTHHLHAHAHAAVHTLPFAYRFTCCGAQPPLAHPHVLPCIHPLAHSYATEHTPP